MASNTYSFGVEPIASHAWNKDRSQLVLSLNSHEVHVYRQAGGSWNKEQTLIEHSQRVTGIDWSPVSNKIVTCGVDRNAYVWTLSKDKWEPVLVILRLNRAATCVKWSPLGNKFAVGSGARLVSICYYEQDNNWWVSKHIKKPIRSTVTSLDWHPNNSLIACGSTDMRARVFSGYIKEIDERPAATPWGAKMVFAQMMAEFSGSDDGWVHSVSFSASGNKLAWVSHGSSISVADATAGNIVVTVKTEFLPFTCLTWVTESSIVAAGYDYSPMLFLHDDKGKLSFVSKLDVPKGSSASNVSAMKRFKELDKKAAVDEEMTLQTLHQNAVTELEIFTGTRGQCSQFTTSGSDGQIIVWDFKSLESSIQGLKLI